MTIEEVLEKIKKAYAQKVAGVRGSTEALKSAVHAYESAAQEDALNYFLITTGILAPDTEKKSETAALTLLDAVEKLPELQSGGGSDMIYIEEEIPEAETVEATTEPPFPLLRGDGRPVLIFGGFTVEDKIRAVKARTGVDVEWISNERNGSGDTECARACSKIKNGHYSGLIMLNELMSHSQGDNLIRAAKAAGVQHAVGKKGGTGTLLRAIELFEKQRTEEKTK